MSFSQWEHTFPKNCRLGDFGWDINSGQKFWSETDVEGMPKYFDLGEKTKVRKEPKGEDIILKEIQRCIFLLTSGQLSDLQSKEPVTEN